jgi:ABC-type amino acid transport substrate-binding protein
MFAKVTLWTIALLAAAPLVRAQKPQLPADVSATASGGVLDRIRTTHAIRIGYRTDARPFSYSGEGGRAVGYSIDMCQHVIDVAKSETGVGDLSVQWVAVTAAERVSAVQRNQVDLLCGAETITLSRRRDVSFSLPIFPGGTGALVRADAPARLREVLSGRTQAFRPTWRASATQVLQARSFSAVGGTTSDRWLTDRIGDLQVIANISRVTGYDAGVQALVERRSDVFFGERAILLETAKRHASSGDLIVIDRLFTYEPLALAFGREDESFRLLVDRTLSNVYSSGALGPLYRKWFDEPDETTLTFFRWNTLPE